MPANSTQGLNNYSDHARTILEKIASYRRSSSPIIEDLANELIAESQKTNDINLQGFGFLVLSGFHCSISNNYKLSLEYADKGINMMEGSFKTRHLPDYYLSKGRCYQFMGDQEKAQSCYLEAIGYLEKRAKKSDEEIHWLAASYYNSYILFNQSGVEFTREDFLNKALALYKSINDKIGLSNCYNSYAASAYKSRNLEETLTNLLKAYELTEQENAYIQLSIYSSNIGLVHAQMGNEAAFREYFVLAVEHTQKTKSRYHEAHMNGQMGEALSFLGIHDEALERLEAAEQIFAEIKAPSSLIGVYNKLAELHATSGAFEKAYNYQLKQSTLLKERFNDEKTSAIARARMLFNLEEKETETELLKQKNEEIKKYLEELRYSNEEFKKFAYIVSHDLREPLRTISSYIKLLERSLAGRLNRDEQEFIDFVVAGSRNMNELISDLLAFSKISFLSDLSSIELHTLVKTVADETALHYQPEKNAKITIEKLPVIVANQTQIKQLFKNLISNAIKYNNNSIPEVKVSYIETKTNHIITVSDDGIGVPEEFRERIFQLFQRLHSKADYHGTGVGLAICKKVMEQMNGSIEIEMNSSGGSDFICSIPKSNTNVK